MNILICRTTSFGRLEVGKTKRGSPVNCLTFFDPMYSEIRRSFPPDHIHIRQLK